MYIYYLRMYYVESNISKLYHAYNIHEYYKNMTTKSDYKIYTLLPNYAITYLIF